MRRPATAGRPGHRPNSARLGWSLVAVFELVMEGRAEGWLAPAGQVLRAVFTDRGGLLTAVAGMAAQSSVPLDGAGEQRAWVSVSTRAWLQAC